MKVEVVPYDPDWPRIYEAEAARLASALSAHALSIEHVGSTAVPDLVAKPVVDIHLTVADSADEASYAPAVEALGYRLVHREADWFEHRMFRLTAPTVNLHVFTVGCPELARCRLFRDWLRANPEDRELYATTKLDLAGRHWSKVQDYADAKTEVVAAIMARAETHQSPSPPHATL